jgi:ATP-dependent Clp protease protease subunit
MNRMDSDLKPTDPIFQRLLEERIVLPLSSGAAGKRYGLPNASVVMHQPHGGFGGTSADIQTQAKQINFFKRRMAELTSQQTGKSVEQIVEDGDRDAWYTASEAQEYGFVDHVIGSTAALPHP